MTSRELAIAGASQGPLASLDRRDAELGRAAGRDLDQELAVQLVVPVGFEDAPGLMDLRAFLVEPGLDPVVEDPAIAKLAGCIAGIEQLGARGAEVVVAVALDSISAKRALERALSLSDRQS